MASKPGTARTGPSRSPRRTVSPSKQEQEPSLEREQALQKQLNDLQKYKELEEKEKKKEEAAKKKELTAAKKRITKEVQNSLKTVKKHDQEVVKLQTNIKKLQGQEVDVKKKTAESEHKFKEKLQVTELKHQDLESKLSQKYADAAQERVKLQQLQLQLDTLANSNIDLSRLALTEGGLGALADGTQPLPALHDHSAVETTDAEGEERYAQAELEVERMARQLDEMRVHYEEAEEQRRRLIDRLGEIERGDVASSTEDVHTEYRDAMESLRSELERLREENEGLHSKLGAANKALELQEECIEELAGRATGVGEGLMNIASQELARCSMMPSDSRVLSSNASRSLEGGGDDGYASRGPDVEVTLGDIIRLNADLTLVREAFRASGFTWDPQIETMLGKAYPVVEAPKPGVVGLPSPDGIQGGIWFFPMAALHKVSTSQPPTPGSASATASTTATRDLYQRATFPKGGGLHDLTLSANLSGRASTPGRFAGYQQARYSTLGGSSGSLATATMQTTMPSPTSPPSFAEAAGEEALQQTATTLAMEAFALDSGLVASAASSTVFVGAIPANVAEETIAQEFLKYGAITDVQVQRDDASGPQRNCALVSFGSVEEATRAVKATSGRLSFGSSADGVCDVGFARSSQAGSAQVSGLSGSVGGLAAPVGGLAAPVGGLASASSGSTRMSGSVTRLTQVFVGAVPNDTTEEALLGELQKYGSVISFQLQRDNSGPQKSYAFASFSSSDDATRVVKALGGGRFVLPGATVPCDVSYAQAAAGLSGSATFASSSTERRAEQPSRQPAAVAQTNQIVVRTIPNETNDNNLLAEFHKYGAVVNCQLHRDPAGPEKSYALVTFSAQDEALRAVEATSQGRLILPGALAPSDVTVAPQAVQPGGPTSGPTLARQQQLLQMQQLQQRRLQQAAGHQVIIYSIPNETPDELLKAEFADFGGILDFKVNRDTTRPLRSFAIATYKTREEAAKAIEVTNGRLLMPGATAPAQVGYPPASTALQGQSPRGAWQSSSQQVVVSSIPEAVSCEALKAEFAKHGAVTDVQIQSDPSGQSKSYAFVTYQTAEDAAKAVETFSSGLLLPGASSPCEVGFAARSTQSATGQAMTPGQLMSLKQQQVRPQSAPRLRSAGQTGPLVRQASPIPGTASASSPAVPPPAQDIGMEAEGASGCAWARDPRRFGQWQPSPAGAVSPRGCAGYEALQARQGQLTPLDMSASDGVLHSARYPRPWAPSDPIAAMPMGAEYRPFSPRVRSVGPRPGTPLAAYGSHVAVPYFNEQHLFQFPGLYPPGVAHVGAASARGQRSPGRSATPQPGGLLLVPAPAVAWRGGYPGPMPLSARGPRTQSGQASVPPGPSGPPSAQGSYVPPAARPPAGGAVSPGLPAQPLVTPIGIPDPLSASTGSGRAGFKDAVAKVTAKALREYRQNHRASLAME